MAFGSSFDWNDMRFDADERSKSYHVLLWYEGDKQDEAYWA